MSMLNRNKHPYNVDEHFLSGKIVVMYVKHRFLHNWVFIALTLFWLLFSVLLFCIMWNEGAKLLFGTGLILFLLYCLLMVTWSKIVDYMNLCLEKKIIYPIVDRLLAKYNPQNEMFSHFGMKRYNFKNETQLFKVIPHTSKNQKNRPASPERNTFEGS